MPMGLTMKRVPQDVECTIPCRNHSWSFTAMVLLRAGAACMVVCGTILLCKKGKSGMHNLNRRSFLKAATAASGVTLASGKIHALVSSQAEPSRPVAANDQIQLALIGAGGQ